YIVFFFQADDGIRDFHVTGVQTCALPILGFTKNSFDRSAFDVQIHGVYFRSVNLVPEKDSWGHEMDLLLDTWAVHYTRYIAFLTDLAQFPSVEICSFKPYKDRKSTRLNSSHVKISYAVFCLKKKKTVMKNY